MEIFMEQSQIHATVDFDRAGKQHGHLCVPYSYNLGGWANLLVPVAVVRNGDGPTVLVLAGNHGDEYPGQVAVLRLMRELRAEQVRGRVLLIPALNLPAAKAATRLSPLDGKNMKMS
jgi:predicted deacylase